MTVVLLTQDSDARRIGIAAGIAGRLGLDLVSQGQLEQIVAGRMRIRHGTLHRYLSGNSSLLQRWLIDRRCLSRRTLEAIVILAARGGVVVESWEIAAPLRAVRHLMCVHVCGSMPGSLPSTARSNTPKLTIGRSDWRPSSATGWVFCIGRGTGTSFDLTFGSGRDGLADGIEHVWRLARSLQLQETAESRSMLSKLLEATHHLPDRVAELADTRSIAALRVEVGNESIPLLGVASSEQAIARIEDLLRGKRTHTAARRPSLPVDAIGAVPELSPSPGRQRSPSGLAHR